jgi:hypothetical protein
LVTETYPPDLNPGALSVGKLVHACISAGHHVTVLAKKHDPDARDGTDPSSCWHDIQECAIRLPEPAGKASRMVTGGMARIWGRLPAIGAWTYAAYKSARALIAREHFDCVMTGYVPFRTAFVGHALKREFGIPWMVRFPDPSPWCLYPAPYGPGRPVTVRDRYIVRRVRSVLKNADALIAPSARMATYLNEVYDGAFGQRQVILPHVGWSRPTNVQGARPPVRILHSGIMMHERESDRIATMLHLALQRVRALGLDVRFTFTGYVSGEKSLPHRMREFEQYIDWVLPVGYEESLAQMSGATGLLLLEAVMREGIYLPSKVADYAVSNKPVLMFSPEAGTVADLVGGRAHPGFLTQDPDLASNRLVEFLGMAAAGENLDAYRFPDPSRFHPERVVGSLVSNLQRYSTERSGTTKPLSRVRG